MYAVECEMPPGSALSRELIEHAHYRDAYRVPLRRRELGVVDVFFAIVAHHPLWMKLLLIVRNRLVALVGLNGSTASEVLDIKIRSHYAVGEKIGRWRIFALGENEVVAGGDDKHLDFRVRGPQPGGQNLPVLRGAASPVWRPKADDQRTSVATAMK
jgi:hypothetical protein